MIVEIIMVVIVFLVFYGVMWALFSPATTPFNDTWGPPGDSWNNTGHKGVHTIKKETSLDGWDMATINQEPIKVTAQTSSTVITQENRKTLPYKRLTTAEANRLKEHMRIFKEKQMSKEAFDGDTIVDEIPYGVSDWKIANKNIPQAKGKVGNR